jgi:hypothetical protein
MQEAAEGQVGQIELFLNNVTLLKDLTKEQRLRLVDAFTEVTYPAESVIITEGEPGDKFYIVKRWEGRDAGCELTLPSCPGAALFGTVILAQSVLDGVAGQQQT